MLRAAQELGPQAGPITLGPPGAARALSLLRRSLTGGTRPSDASSTSRRGPGELNLIAGELPASAIGRASILGLLRIACGARTTRYPPQSPLLASTADGGTNRASTGHCKRVKREPKSA